MADPFIGEIRMFAGNYAPKGWALCDGQLVSVSDNEPLFSLLQTTYGGDGLTTFGLPDLRGRLPVHFGEGPGLSNRPIGQKSGYERVTLTSDQIPSHNHSFMASSQTAASLTLTSNVLAQTPAGDDFYAPPDTDKQVNLIQGTIQTAGENQPHSNIMPFMCINFIIAMSGIYPSRN